MRNITIGADSFEAIGRTTLNVLRHGQVVRFTCSEWKFIRGGLVLAELLIPEPSMVFCPSLLG